MSANNWTACPRCKKRRTKKINDNAPEIVKLFDAFKDGEMEGTTFTDKVRELTFTPELKQNFGENYEIYLDPFDETFYVDYGGFCRDCGFQFNYKVEIMVTGLDDDD